MNGMIKKNQKPQPVPVVSKVEEPLVQDATPSIEKNTSLQAKQLVKKPKATETTPVKVQKN